ncbi:F20B24.10 [Arabidopsis thaliana]|uniref:F20B24.10 n=1 Tax=Arabidopsis thaliana TaxID=3702 RepID=Q9SGY3_ARATH|nr:F20B24.10 [Arabidopsis thaliana]
MFEDRRGLRKGYNEDLKYRASSSRCEDALEESLLSIFESPTSSYWLNWRVLLCALILLAPIVLAAVLIWKYEGKRRRQRESQRELPGTLFQDEAWTTCFKRIHPLWLLAFRVDIYSCHTLLWGTSLGNSVVEVTTLVLDTKSYASVLSVYGCCIYNKEASGNMESYTSIGDTEQGTYRPPIALDGEGNTSKASNRPSEAPARKTAGFWVYIFQILFQTCAGAVVLTDIVFWAIIYPFTKGYKLSFLDVCMHSLNAVFLLGDTSLNSLNLMAIFFLPYPAIPTVPDCLLCTLELYFRGLPMDNPCRQELMSRSVFTSFKGSCYTCFAGGHTNFLIFRHHTHPYVAVMHIPCFAVFALVIKLKNYLLQQRHNSFFVHERIPHMEETMVHGHGQSQSQSHSESLRKSNPLVE